ncbi:MAG: putative toxin-antitoxin system toxin component, PIN family [Pirellula sp.]
MERPRVVFDCMIFLQAAARPMGPAAALLELVEVGALELLVSDACIEEFREVLTRPSLQRKFPSLSISAVQDFLDRIQACSVYSVNIANIFVLERDPKDAKYVDLAIATKADFLVTRDKDLLDLREKESPLIQIFEKLDWQFKIVDPFEMLTFLRKE